MRAAVGAVGGSLRSAAAWPKPSPPVGSAIAAAPQAEIYVSGRALVRLLPGDAGLDRPARLEPMPLIKASAPSVNQVR
jgi:hypothetical protein